MTCSPPGHRIALLGPDGAPLLAALHASATPAEAWDAPAYRRLLALAGCFACATDAGFVLARAAADEAEILMLTVAAPSRRQGLARALLQAAGAEAARRGARTLFLEVAAGNRPALALYAGERFVEVGRRVGYYPDGADALVLRLNLRACGS